MTSKASVLITGGLGFIGSHLANRLSERDDVSRIIIVDLGLSWALSRNVIARPEKIELQTFDIQDEQRIAECASRCSTIYHLAAESHVQRSIVDPRRFLDTNIIGTFSVLEAARKYGSRLIFASTSEVYGSVDNELIQESHPLEPYSPYAATKLAADRLVAAYVRAYSVDATIVRMFNVYGPGQYFEKLIPMFICSVLCGMPFPVQGDGSATRDWSYIDDVCTQLLMLFPPQSVKIRNLGSGITRSVNQIAYDIASLAGLSRPEWEHYPERAGHVASQSTKGAVIAAHSEPEVTSFDAGLKQTFYWYQQRISQWRELFLSTHPTIMDQLK